MQQVEHMVDTLHLEDLRNHLHPSIFDENDDYDMLIVRLPVIAKTLEVISLGFIITKEGSYLFNAVKNRLEGLESRFDGPHHKIDALLDKLLKAFQAYQDQIFFRFQGWTIQARAVCLISTDTHGYGFLLPKPFWPEDIVGKETRQKLKELPCRQWQKTIHTVQ